MMAWSAVLCIAVLALAATVRGSDSPLQVTCKDNQFRCADGSTCIYSANVCDYVRNCPDASDELNWTLCQNILKMKKDQCGAGQIYCTTYNSRCKDIIDACKTSCRSNDNRFTSVCNEISGRQLQAPNPSNLPQATEPPVKEKKEMEVDPEFKDLLTSITTAFNGTSWAFNTCPPLYKSSNGMCVFTFTPIKLSWSTAQTFCKSLAGTLAILDDVQDFSNVLDYFHHTNITSKFWIGGRYKEESADLSPEGSWLWENGKPIKMTAPFWNVFTTGTKENGTRARHLRPQNEESIGKCLAMLDDNFYYFSDESCHLKLSPVCIHPLA